MPLSSQWVSSTFHLSPPLFDMGPFLCLEGISSASCSVFYPILTWKYTGPPNCLFARLFHNSYQSCEKCLYLKKDSCSFIRFIGWDMPSDMLREGTVPISQCMSLECVLHGLLKVAFHPSSTACLNPAMTWIMTAVFMGLVLLGIQYRVLL